MHKDQRLSMSNHKMGRKQYSSEEVSKSWFSSLLEKWRDCILFFTIISQPVSQLKFPHEDTKPSFEYRVSLLPADVMKGGSEYSS